MRLGADIWAWHLQEHDGATRRSRRQNLGNRKQGRCHGEIKLALRAPSHPTCGTKLALLARKGPFWRILRTHGELSTAAASNKPRRANFVPNTSWMRGQQTQQHTRPHWCEGRRRDRRAWLRCRWAVAGPGRTTHRDPDRLEAAARPAGPGRTTSRRAERSSQRGRQAGGQAARRPEICRGNKQQATSNKQGIQKRPPGTGWAHLSRLWESNPRPIHYE